MAIAGAGVGFAMPTTMNIALDELSADRAGVGSGLLMVLRQVGGTAAVAVLGTVLNSAYRSHVVTTGLPAQAADAVKRSASSGVALANKLGSTTLLDSVRNSLVHATSLTLVASAAVAIVGVLAATRLPRRTGGVGDKVEVPAQSGGDLIIATD
jgi:hypothetical protein